MTNRLTRWVDAKIAGLGYVKADKKPARSITSLFSGEASQYTTITTWDDWTDEQIERLAVTSSWVWSDISLIASTLSIAEFGVYQKSGEGLEEVILHPFEVLFEWPNQFMDQVWLLEYSIWWYLLRGEAYWWLVPDRSGQLAEIWPIPSSRMSPVKHPAKYIDGYAYASPTRAKKIIIPREQVCFVRRPNMFDYHRGMSPISSFRRELEGDVSAAKWNRDTFENELVLRMLINLPQDTSDPVYHSLRQELIDELQTKGRRWWIARAGDVNVQELGMNPKDAEYLAGRKFTRDQIDRIYGFPEGFWSQQATRSNSEAARTTFIENAVWPVAKKFAAAITGQILFPYYGKQYRGKFADTRPRDRRLRVLEQRQQWTVCFVNEAREELGKPRLPDDDPRGQLLVPQLTMQRGVPITTVQAMSPYNQGEGQDEKALLLLPPAVQGLVLKEAQEDLRRWKSIELRRLEEGQEIGTYEFETESIPLEVQNYVSLYLEEATTEDDIREVFEDAKLQLGETSVPELLAPSSAKGMVSPNGETVKQVDWDELTPEGRLIVEKRLSRKLKAVLATWLSMMARAIVSGEEAPLNEVEFGQQIAAPVTVVLVEYATARAQQAMAELGPEVDPAQIAVAALEWAHGYGATLAQQLAQTSAKAVNAAAEQFRLNPVLTEAQISDMIEPAFSEPRADKISVSELTAAFSFGVLLAKRFLEGMGVRTQRIWKSVLEPGVTCTICWDLHDLPEEEWVAEYPEGPPIHSNCKCEVYLEEVKE